MVLDICKELAYHRLEVSVFPEERVEFEGGLGAVLRNNLLYAAGHVMTEDHVSLLEVIDRLNVPEDHFLHKSLKDGFPKGFALFVVSPENIYASHCVLRPNQALVFSIVLIGRLSAYYKNFIEAVKAMCTRGFGQNMVHFHLDSICEKDIAGRSHRVAVAHSDVIAPLRYPVCLQDFEEEKFGCVEKIIRLQLKSPVALTSFSRKRSKGSTYQDKLNGFPSFYQFVRSAIYRCFSLSVLYQALPEPEVCWQAQDDIDAYLEATASALLLRADIRRVSMHGSKRNDDKGRITLSGYVGELTFGGDFSKYIALLLFMQDLGLGNDTVYGLGHYRVEVLKVSGPEE